VGLAGLLKKGGLQRDKTFFGTYTNQFSLGSRFDFLSKGCLPEENNFPANEENSKRSRHLRHFIDLYKAKNVTDEAKAYDEMDYFYSSLFS